MTQEEWEQVNKQTKSAMGHVKNDFAACFTCATEKHGCTRSSIWPSIVSNDEPLLCCAGTMHLEIIIIIIIISTLEADFMVLKAEIMVVKSWSLTCQPLFYSSLATLS